MCIMEKNRGNGNDSAIFSAPGVETDEDKISGTGGLPEGERKMPMKEPQILEDDQLLSAAGGVSREKQGICFQLTIGAGTSPDSKREEVLRHGVSPEGAEAVIAQLTLIMVRSGFGTYEISWREGGPTTVMKVF